MMDKKPHIKPYLYGMFAGFGAISLSILFFFLIYRFQGFGNAVSTLTGILMPFIYGSVIAYLLKPVCNWIEAFLHKLFPERMHRFANMLAVALTILFGLLLIYALIMMIVPQLINSVTALYFTARDNIGDFVEWISKQEFIANNKKLLDFIESSYDSLDANLDAWIKNTLLPSMQNILSGAAVGVVNVVTWIKNFVIGLIVSVYLLASRKKFGHSRLRRLAGGRIHSSRPSRSAPSTSRSRSNSAMKSAASNCAGPASSYRRSSSGELRPRASGLSSASVLICRSSRVGSGDSRRAISGCGASAGCCRAGAAMGGGRRIPQPASGPSSSDPRMIRPVRRRGSPAPPARSAQAFDMQTRIAAHPSRSP